MVKFLASKSDGSLIIGLGVTEKNLEALKRNLPIMVTIEEIPIPPGADLSKSNIMIFYGTNEEAIREALSEFITPSTMIVDERKS